MKIDRLFTRRVMAISSDSQLAEAAAAMGRFAVGSLLVIDAAAPHKPVGIVTDRDLAIQGFAAEGNAVAHAMTPVLATIDAGADMHEALELMRAHAVRRLVVTAPDGSVCGILSIDDIIDGLSADLSRAAEVLKGVVNRQAAGPGEVKVGG